MTAAKLDQLYRLCERDDTNPRPPLWDRSEQDIIRDGLKQLLEENRRLLEELDEVNARLEEALDNLRGAYD